MTHDQASALALRGIDSQLPEHERSELAAHLEACTTCRAEVERLRAADGALRAWGAEQAPAPPNTTPPFRSDARLSGRRWWPVATAAAIVGVALGAVGGYAAGSRAAIHPATQTVADSRPTFALLLEEPAGQWPPRFAAARPGYIEWRDSLELQGHFVGGERLSVDAGRYIAMGDSTGSVSTAPTGANFSGFFTIRARDYDEAVRIARASPHLRYGGVLVRRTF